MLLQGRFVLSEHEIDKMFEHNIWHPIGSLESGCFISIKNTFSENSVARYFLHCKRLLLLVMCRPRLF